MRRRGLLVALASAFFWAGQAQAATFTVTRTDDPAPGACDSDCSLREAVRAANAGSGGDAIVIPPGHYRLTRAGAGENAALTGDLDVTKDVTINGAGARSTAIDAVGGDRVFDIGAVAVEIFRVTITGGLVDGNGGGIANAGTLRLVEDTISGNHAVYVNNQSGGGIDSTGSLVVEATTISGNRAYNGGGINFSGALTVTNSTISGNLAGGWMSNGDGGGIEGSAGATVSVSDSTIAGNQSFNGPFSGGGISSSSATVKGSIIAGNVAHDPALTTTAIDNCSAPVTSQGHNLSDGAGCGLTGTGDHQNVDVKLGPLAANGGPTDTHMPLPGSPAIEGGDNAACPASDQRGAARPRGTCDIGAYELSPPIATTTPAVSVTATGATLSATIVSGIRETTFHFEYGTTTAYGTSTPERAVGEGNSVVRVTAPIKFPATGSSFHFRVVATNGDGTSAGADRALPVLSSLRVRPAAFRRLAVVSFTLSETADTTFRVERCVRRRGRACAAYGLLRGSFVRGGLGGRNSFYFRGRIGGRKLARGSYRLVATAKDPTGNMGRPKRAAFRIR